MRDPKTGRFDKEYGQKAPRDERGRFKKDYQIKQFTLGTLPARIPDDDLYLPRADVSEICRRLGLNYSEVSAESQEDKPLPTFEEMLRTTPVYPGRMIPYKPPSLWSRIRRFFRGR
jgi:hypothetical protein